MVGFGNGFIVEVRDLCLWFYLIFKVKVVLKWNEEGMLVDIVIVLVYVWWSFFFVVKISDLIGGVGY